MIASEPLIFELSASGRNALSLPSCDVPEVPVEMLIPLELLTQLEPQLPELSEVDVVRHFTRLSTLNYGLDTGFYPLGSCTMKYNPKVNERLARLPGFTDLHPYQPESMTQGALQLMAELQDDLCELTGMDGFTLQPAAGAHGELTGMLIVRAYHKHRGDHKRTKVIVPDAAHGTNPATAAMAGYEIIVVPSNARGGVDLEELKKVVNDEVAALMLTNPNTGGLFEENIVEITSLIHEAGGLLYYDGANTNAVMGITRPGDMGFDVVHLNLHKTFSTPHGGGGPGSGPVGVKKDLVPFLPKPVIEVNGDGYFLDYDRKLSIGKIKSFYGNFGVAVKAFAYIRSLGADGLREVSEIAVLNANYIRAKLQDYYDLPYGSVCMHEVVFSAQKQTEFGVSALDIAKRLIDFGYHPPTIYFPMIVKEAMMIEPTETESKETLDEFIEAMLQIAKEAETNPELIKGAPHNTIVLRLDEAKAARNPVLKYTPLSGY